MSPKTVALLSITALTAACGGERGDAPPERPAPAQSSPAAATPRPPSEPGTFPGGVAAGATPEAVRAALDDPPSWRRIHHGDGCVVESWYSAELTHLGEPGGSSTTSTATSAWASPASCPTTRRPTSARSPPQGSASPPRR